MQLIIPSLSREQCPLKIYRTSIEDAFPLRLHRLRIFLLIRSTTDGRSDQPQTLSAQQPQTLSAQPFTNPNKSKRTLSVQHSSDRLLILEECPPCHLLSFHNSADALPNRGHCLRSHLLTRSQTRVPCLYKNQHTFCQYADTVCAVI